MKKVLFIATIPSSIKEFSLDFMRFIRNRGFYVEAIAGIGSQAEFVRQQGFKCHEIEIARGINPIKDIISLFKIKKIIQDGNFDLVHTQTAKAGFIGRIAAWTEKVPIIIHTAHAWPFHPFLSFWKKKYYLYLEKLAGKLCDAIIVDSKEVKRYGQSFKVAPESKVHQIYMGIDLERFKPCGDEQKVEFRRRLNIPIEKIIVGAISRLVNDKGIETIIECADALKTNFNVEFLILGEGEQREKFEKMITARGLNEKIHLLGYINDVLPYLQAFDIFFLPTWREGFGVVFAEAQACGIPVISSKIAPLDEVVSDNCSGFLFPPNSVVQFVEATIKLFDKERRRKMGECGVKHIRENFDLRRINEQTLSLYQSLFNQKTLFYKL
ncbi:glycosyltransferase family 4 protein [Candidatus Falkowbacteria bacterium]|nr:glycosyltransferase family 4 protein [Candidatus Falkowbacteria bacterium]